MGVQRRVPLENPDVYGSTGIILLVGFRPSMPISLAALLAALSSIIRSRAELQLENLALRHQIGVLQRSARKRPKLSSRDRLFWVALSRLWRDWRSTLLIVKPETVIAWRAYVERVIGSIRRECLDHVIVFDEGSLRRVLASYLEYYHRCRTHLALEKDSPEPRPIQPPELGPVVAVPQVAGLHHRYERGAA